MRKTKEQIENDTLINRFMGIAPRKLIGSSDYSWSDQPFYSVSLKSYEETEAAIANYSKYSTSWDWLMPVVRKCHEVDKAFIREEIGDRNMYGANIDIVYSAVVIAIKWHNSQQI